MIRTRSAFWPPALAARRSFSENVHKAVLPSAARASISHIVEKFPEDVEIVVAVGHRKDRSSTTCASLSKRHFNFVEIER